LRVEEIKSYEYAFLLHIIMVGSWSYHGKDNFEKRREVKEIIAAAFWTSFLSQV